MVIFRTYVVGNSRRSNIFEGKLALYHVSLMEILAFAMMSYDPCSLCGAWNGFTDFWLSNRKLKQKLTNIHKERKETVCGCSNSVIYVYFGIKIKK